MATNRDLLKEAIADAKAVKETAIANAKAALEEAFAPQFNAIFAAKLQEMELEEEDKLDEAEKCSACDCDPCECDESVTESFEQMLSRMRDIAGIKEGKKPDFLDMDKDGDKKEPFKKAVDDKEEKKVDESILAATANLWSEYKGKHGV